MPGTNYLRYQVAKQRSGFLGISTKDDTYVVFEHFLREEDLDATVATLTAAGIECRPGRQGGGPWRENLIIGHRLQPPFYVEIPREATRKARYTVLSAAEDTWVGDAVLSHPLASYSDRQLRDTLDREDAFGLETQVVAKNLLRLRGVEVDVNLLESAARGDLRGKETGAGWWRAVVIVLLVLVLAWFWILGG